MRLIAFALLCVSSLFNGSAIAAQPVTGDLAISVGDSIQGVKLSLDSHGVAFSQDSLAMVAKEPYLTFEVDPKQSFTIVSFNEATKKVSVLTLVVHPPNQPQKSYQSRLNLRSLTLHKGGDYTARIAKDGIEAR